MRADEVLDLARARGFDLAGVAPALPLEPDAEQFLDWVSRGLAGRMSYLTDHRAHLRADPRHLLPSARSVICVGKLYNRPDSGPVARYARAEDYHDVLRRDLEGLADDIGACEQFDYRICVDTAPLLERSYAREAGLGWIGRNTCLINQNIGSYVLLGEMLTSLDLASGTPAPDRCGSCTRCIDACPTEAIVPGGLRTELDATRCISYFTIELKGSVPEEFRSAIGPMVFGCDICQEVCPWNWKAPYEDAAASPDLDALADLSAEQFRALFRNTPMWRSKYSGLMRNAAVAMGNSGDRRYRSALERLAALEDELVRSHAEWALRQLK